MKNGVIHTTSFHYKYHAQDSCLHPGGLLPGCQERRPRRDKGGATVPVAASPGFCVRDGSPPGRRQLRWLRSRQPAPQGDARESHGATRVARPFRSLQARGFASGMEARQGGGSSAGSVHDSPPRRGTPGKAINRRGTERRRGRRTITGTVTTEK